MYYNKKGQNWWRHMEADSLQKFNLSDYGFFWPSWYSKIAPPKVSKILLWIESSKSKIQNRLFLVAKNLTSYVKKSEIHPSVVSDHQAIYLLLSCTSEISRGPGLWKFNDTLLNDSDYVIKIHATYSCTCTPIWKTSVFSGSSFPSKIYTTVKINGQRSIQMKVDRGAETCILTTEDLQRLGISVEIKPCSSILKGYGGNFIEYLGITTLQVTFKDTLVSIELTIVEAPGHPSMIGCWRGQELGITSIHVEKVSSDSTSPVVRRAAQHVGLSKATVINKVV